MGVGCIIFFVNAWIGGVLLASYDETGDLTKELNANKEKLKKKTQDMTSTVEAQNQRMVDMLTQSVLHELNQLIAHMRTIVGHCDNMVMTQLVDDMATCILKIRKSAVSHFRFKTEDSRSHRFMRNLLCRDIVQTSNDFRLRDALDLTTVREFFSARTGALTSTPLNVTLAEEALWPRDEMLKKLNGYRQTAATEAGAGDVNWHDPNRSLFSSPFCRSLLFGLLTSCLLCGFYLYTGTASLVRLFEDDCGRFCQLDAADDLIRKLIGISASVCQIGAIIVIIYNLNNLDPILVLRNEVEEYEHQVHEYEQLSKIFDAGAKETNNMGQLLQEIHALIEVTGEFVRKLAGTKLPPQAFQELSQQLKCKTPSLPTLLGTSASNVKSTGTSHEVVPLLQTA